MNISNEELKDYFFGAYYFEDTKDGYLQAFSFTPAQIEYFKKTSDFWYEGCLLSSCKTIEMITDATELEFSYKIVHARTPDSIEIFVDDIATNIFYLKDIEEKGKIKATLPEGEKKVTIYLPSDALAVVKDFSINGEATAPQKDASVLWLGDSITQGYGPLRSAHTMVSVANRVLNYHVINQGIGGYVYDKNSLMKLDGYSPDKIIVALGTNQYGNLDMTDIEQYYDRLMELYPDIPVLAITPTWRGDNEEGIPTLFKFCDKLKEVIARYPKVKMVDGMTLLPHLPEYYLDNLHPNQLGAEVYGRNLVEKIRDLQF